MRDLAALAASPRRPRGRPTRRHAPAVRKRHIRAATDYIVRGLSLRECGRVHGVSAGTVARWVDLALVGDEPAVEMLRVLAAGYGWAVPPMPLPRMLEAD